MDAILGCATHRVFVAARGGTPLLAELPYASLTASHVLNDVGTGSVVTSNDKAPDCEAILGDIEPWEHEIVIFRGEPDPIGYSADPWWAGPVSIPQWDWANLTVGARDLWTWFERRDLLADRNYPAPGTELVTIFAQYMADAYDQDTSPNITFVPNGTTGVLAVRSVTAASSTRAGDALRELGRTGVDWTTVGRSVIYGGNPIPAEPLFVLRDECIDQPQVTKQGPNMGTRVTVNGGTPSGLSTPARGVAGGPTMRHGLVQQTFTETTILDDLSAHANAANRLAFLDPAPRYLTADLTPDAPVDFNQLVPGVRIDAALVIGFRKEVDAFRLQQVQVTATGGAGGQAGTETVKLTLVPLFVPL